MPIKITDLIDPQEIERLKQLDEELEKVLETYTNVAKSVAKGIDISVNVVGDIEKLEKLLVEKGKEAADVQQQLTRVIDEQSKAIANTTNTISRQLMEQERVNKTQRDSYTEHAKVKEMIDLMHGSYESQVKDMVRLQDEIKKVSQAQKDNEKAFKEGKVTSDEYAKTQEKLVARSRELKQEKSRLNQIMTAEEKASQQVEGSYVQMSQQLELLKKSYKELSESARDTDDGKALEALIQNLDAHLKDLAADMGEFQRNVGNYAIAGQNGVVATESLISVLNQKAVTLKDVSDQTKILEEGILMLSTDDEHYAETLALVNAQLEKNRQRLADVSDIMEKQATSVAEAESQNKRLQEALKLVDLNSDDAKETIQALNDKIDENNRIISENSVAQSSLKKDLKELVLDIATLTIEYQALSEEERNSAEGQELRDHINDLIERAAVLKDAIADTNQAISNAASDTRGFDQLTGVMQLTIDGFGLAEGAAHLLGISSEELTEIQTKLQAAIAASNAMQSIQNTLQSQSAVMQGVNLVQTRLRTIAENLHTAAKGKGVIATNLLTAAQWAFNAAANANPIGLLVVAIVACIGAVYGLVKAFQAFFGVSDESLKKYEEQRQALDDLCDANDRLIDRMKARGATEAELLEQSLLNKQAEKEASDEVFRLASELYDEDEDEYKDALEAKKKADEEFERHKEDSLNYLLKVIHQAEEEEKKERLGTYEYKRQLIQAELEQQKAIAATLLAQEKITRQVYENLVASLDKAARLKIDKVNADEAKDQEKQSTNGTNRKSSGGNSRTDDARRQAEELKKAVRDGEDALLNVIVDSNERQRQAEILSYSRRLKDLQEQLAKAKESQVSMRNALQKQIEGLAAEHNRKMDELQLARVERMNKTEAEFVESHLAIVKDGSQEEYDWRLRQLEVQKKAELIAIQKSEAEQTLTVELAEEMRINLAIKYDDMRERLAEEHASKMADMIMNEYSVANEQRETEHIIEMARLREEYNDRIRAAKGHQGKMEKAEKDFTKAMKKLQDDYAVAQAESIIEMYRKMLDMEDLTDEMRGKVKDNLERAIAELRDLKAQIFKPDPDESGGLIPDDFIKGFDKWSRCALSAIDTVNSYLQAFWDNQISKIEEMQEANNAAGESEQERITELVEKKVITEEEGEARKRAAEAKTAKKNEELEKKKQQLKIKQAKWDKANSIAQATISTALAVMNALNTQPFWLGIVLAALAGAMGAVQIATIVATPIPQYAKGTGHHKGGPAIVGDGGVPELVMYSGKSWITPDKPTIVDLPAGAVVVPDIDGIAPDIAGLAAMPLTSDGNKPIIVNNDYSRLESKMDSFILMLQKQTASQRRFFSELSFDAYANSRI